MQVLEKAWQLREDLGIFNESDAVRIFHGPGDGAQSGAENGDGVLKNFAIDRFNDFYWITQWETSVGQHRDSALKEGLATILQFLKKKGAVGVSGLNRPQKGIPAEATVFSGHPPSDRVLVQEFGLKFWIQLQGARHPGLFLDHLPLRLWLKKHSAGLRVLNTFAYTGSLSVAAGAGGATHVTTLDLSKPSIQWAQDNWSLNHLSDQKSRFIYGDVFEWMPRLKKQGEQYDCVILDPPSFSHGKKGQFSTAKDLERLHLLAFELLAPGGYLITSINSANVSWKSYEGQVFAASQKAKREAIVLKKISLPETFPTELGRDEEQYLKGWILKV